MWSVWNRPNGGSLRIDARTSSLTGFALRSTVNSRGPSVMQRLYIRSLPGFCLDERRFYDLTFEAAAADVHRDGLAVGNVFVGVDQRERDANFQSRRKGSRCRQTDRSVAVEHREVGPQHPAADGPQPAQHPLRARLLLGQQCVASPEGALFPPDGPSAPRLQRRDVQ